MMLKDKRRFRFSTFNLLTILLLMQAMSYVGNVVAAEPKVPFTYAKGVTLFNKFCSGCHGKTMEGSKQGPPLMHAFYKPSHHNDSSFYRAALKGVRAHHWNFGDMPPVPGISKEDMDAIVPYVRWYQKQKGLFK